MSPPSSDTPEEDGRNLAKSMVRDALRDLMLADPEFRASLRPVLKSLIREILQEERLLPP
jgi:dephospho-CoA kinase